MKIGLEKLDTHKGMACWIVGQWSYSYILDLQRSKVLSWKNWRKLYQ